MSHFAKVENGIVTEVIVATKAEINSERHGDEFLWIQCSYNNTFGGAYPGVGDSYLEDQKVFRKKAPFPSWSYDTDTNTWEPPVPDPSVDTPDEHMWREDLGAWEDQTKTGGPTWEEVTGT